MTTQSDKQQALERALDAVQAAAQALLESLPPVTTPMSLRTARRISGLAAFEAQRMSLQRLHQSKYHNLRNNCHQLQLGSGKRFYIPLDKALVALRAAVIERGRA